MEVVKLAVNHRTKFRNAHLSDKSLRGWPLWSRVLVSYCEFDTFPLVSGGQVWFLIVLIPDLCTLTYFTIVDDKP